MIMANASNGIYPPVYTGTVGKLRLLISDMEPLPVAGDPNSEYLFSDDALTAMSSITGESLYRAAAVLLRTMASSEIIIGKKIRNDEISTDGAAVAEALRKLANDFDDRADEEDAAALEETFEIFDPFENRYCSPEAAPRVWNSSWD